MSAVQILLFPAYAGVIPMVEATAGRKLSFPRIRGGDPISKHFKASEFQLFPAYAGVIPLPLISLFSGESFPRIRGGDLTRTRPGSRKFSFSPHMRG